MTPPKKKPYTNKNHACKKAFSFTWITAEEGHQFKQEYNLAHVPSPLLDVSLTAANRTDGNPYTVLCLTLHMVQMEMGQSRVIVTNDWREPVIEQLVVGNYSGGSKSASANFQRKPCLLYFLYFLFFLFSSDFFDLSVFLRFLYLHCCVCIFFVLLVSLYTVDAYSHIAAEVRNELQKIGYYTSKFEPLIRNAEMSAEKFTTEAILAGGYTALVNDEAGGEMQVMKSEIKSMLLSGMECTSLRLNDGDVLQRMYLVGFCWCLFFYFVCFLIFFLFVFYPYCLSPVLFALCVFVVQHGLTLGVLSTNVHTLTLTQPHIITTQYQLKWKTGRPERIEFALGKRNKRSMDRIPKNKDMQDAKFARVYIFFQQQPFFSTLTCFSFLFFWLLLVFFLFFFDVFK